jgi:hypothetical protein
MSGEAPLVRTFSVGRYRCTLTLAWQPHGAGDMKVEWQPDVPPRRSLSRAEVEQYQAGRNAAIAAFSAEKGIGVAVVDL